MMSVWHSVSHAGRSLRRAPVFSSAVILTLTVGIGSAAAIFAVVDAVLLRPLPYGHPAELVSVSHDLPAINMQHAGLTRGMYFTYKKLAHTLANLAAYRDESANVTDAGDRAQPERMTVGEVTANLFPILEVPPLFGRTFSAEDDAPKAADVTVISEGLWRTRFGADRNVLGKRLVIDGHSTEIIGVMPGSFQFPSPAVKLWLPAKFDPNDPVPGGFSQMGLARLAPGVSIEAAQRDLVNVLPRMVEVSPNVAPGVTSRMLLDQTKPRPELVPLRDTIVADVAKTLWMVAGAAMLVLLVTCANVANLMLVRADGRNRELSVRAALGAGQGRVIAHFLSEAAVLAGVAAALGLGVTAIAVGLLVRAGPSELPRLAEIRVGPAVVAFTIGVSALVALACSALPVSRFARSDLFAGLREGGRSGMVGAARQRVRKFLVAGQMALALVALVASGLLLRSFENLQSLRPGFDADHVATVWLSLPGSRYPSDTAVVQFYSGLQQRVAQLAGVSAAGLTGRLPLVSSGMDLDPMLIEGQWDASKQIPPLQIYSSADGAYFRAMGIPLIVGRTFDRMDRQRGDEAIISQETAARMFGDSTGRSALGKRFRILPSGPWHTIIGVVGGARDTSLFAPPTSATYLPEALGADTVGGTFARSMAIVARTRGDVAGTTRSIERVVHDLDPTLPTFDIRPMREVVNASIARLKFTMIVLGAAASVTLLLGVIGLYGVIAYIVTLRWRELGVRIALGAEPRSIAAMVARQGFVLAAAGAIAGVAMIVAIARFLRSFLFEVAPVDPLTLVAASILLVCLALLASWIPAQRAARVDPTEALRAE